MQQLFRIIFFSSLTHGALLPSGFLFLFIERENFYHDHKGNNGIINLIIVFRLLFSFDGFLL